MPFEEIDKKVNEAADQHHPAYNDKAWVMMEKLLDKHLPLKKKKRRRFVFWFFPLVISAGAAFFIFNNKPGKEKYSVLPTADTSLTKKESNRISAGEKNEPEINTVVKPVPGSLQEKRSDTNSITNNVVPGIEKPKELNSQVFKVISEQETVRKAEVKKSTSKNRTSAGSGNKETKPAESKIGVDLISEPVTENTMAVATEAVKDEVRPTKFQGESDQQITVKKTDTLVSVPDKPVPLEKNSSALEVKKEKVKKPSALNKNFLFISASIAPDISFVSGDKLGKTKMIAGAGIGYSIRNRFVIRSGFYAGKKVYSASGNTYNPPASFFQYYPILENVNADCKVYEIPLLISYSFGKSNKRNWFASAGVSTVLMKKEVYDYAYKYSAAGATYYKTRSISNENNHFFSLLTLSGGYQKNVGKRIFFAAEPYLKLPLAGVGFGKVKLNSTGIMFSAGYRLTGIKK